MFKQHKNLAPGTIVFVDSNFATNFDCFGVIVDKKFWDKAVKEEGIILPLIEERLRTCRDDIIEVSHFFRVLGTLPFRKHWLDNDPLSVEPDSLVITHYGLQIYTYVDEIDLRPLIKTINDLESINRGASRILSMDSRYISSALRDANIVYRYLDGERFQSKKGGYVGYEEKFLRLLSKAIPMK